MAAQIAVECLTRRLHQEVHELLERPRLPTTEPMTQTQ
jgi:hypothetical protein